MTVEIEQEADGRILIEIPELAGAMAYGRTIEEALAGVAQIAGPLIIERLRGALDAQLYLELGRRYRARDGSIWLCYRVSPLEPRWKQALCIEPKSGIARQFFIDGRCDENGRDPYTLIEEITA